MVAVNKDNGKRDERFTLILIMGYLFLFVLNMQKFNPATSENIENQEYDLKADFRTLYGTTENEGRIEYNSFMPVDLTPFFFGKLSINRADKDLLMTIKGVGPKLAQNIIDSRSKDGPFKKSDDLLRIKGVGIKRLRYFGKVFNYE